MPTLPNLRIGLSGFPHPDWKGLVYPQEAAIRRHALETLARFVDVVELDRLPRSETAQVWLHSIRDNPRFRFPRSCRGVSPTAQPGGAAIASFKQGLWPLHKAGRLGAVVLEFPWAFRYNRKTGSFSSVCAAHSTSSR